MVYTTSVKKIYTIIQLYIYICKIFNVVSGGVKHFC